MNFALIGPSGAGKGTHADHLINRFHLLHVSTGDLLRHNLEGRTALGLLARKYMAAGELVPDEVVDAMIEEWVRRNGVNRNLFFDGFPRTVDQAQFLDELLSELGRELSAVVYLKTRDQAILGRLSGRWICHTCDRPYHAEAKPPRRAGQCDVCGGELYQRPDDVPDMVQTRLKVFHRVTDRVVDYYQTSGRLVIVDGDADFATVAQRLTRAFEAVTRRQSASATLEETEAIRSLKPPPTLVDAREIHPGLGLVLVGAPGSGKGTQAARLSERFKIPHVATGDLFRENLRRGTELGKLAQSYMSRGQLVPDNITESMVQERLALDDTMEGFVLDGFPRKLSQAEALAEMTATLRRQLAGVIVLEAPDETIVERLSGRLVCSRCQAPFHTKFKQPAHEGVCDLCQGPLVRRDDDNPETVRNRLRTYHAQTEPLIEYYRSQGLVIEVDGDGPVAQVTERMTAAAESLAESGSSVCR